MQILRRRFGKGGTPAPGDPHRLGGEEERYHDQVRTNKEDEGIKGKQYGNGSLGSEALHLWPAMKKGVRRSTIARY
ncbi:hypothetical protein Taro_023996 [Colocasia esculenta]|uniref:Uncharacterized protein n=1 Tax=Colocasia esculenta TaxID=4460 RepID=A0A843VD44_COLES|nr:hypothetical protein [Colocasia esculenta]